jgi:nitrogen regulatory protein P-II 1
MPYPQATVMKKVEAVIRPFKLAEVKDCLSQIGVEVMTVSEVRDYGWQKGLTEIRSGDGFQANFLPRLKIEIVVCDGKVESAIRMIIGCAHTKKNADGRISVVPVLDAVRIRTAERGDQAV